MGKEFVEYHNKNGTIPYSASTICFCLTQYAKDYIKENREIISKIDSKVRDAVLVDVINYLGGKGCCDFALYTCDLYDEKKHDELVDPQCLLSAVPNHYANYMFCEGTSISVLRNNHMNECVELFNKNDGALVLIDFINYIAQRNDFDRTFTIQELNEKAQKKQYIRDMNELKAFLELSNQYTERLLNGESIDSIYSQIAEEHDLKFISKRGVYHYTDEIRGIVMQIRMFPWDKNAVDKELYAMTYAYVKTNQGKDNIQKTETEIVTKKMKEMKKR